MTQPAINRLGNWLDATLSWLAATILFCMMLLTSADVFMRYLLNAPIRGAFEIAEILMAIVIFAGLPLVSRHDEHVTVDFADRLLPAWARRITQVVVHACCGAMLLGMSWLILLKAQRVHEYGDNTATLKIALAPFAYFMSALILVTALVHLVKMFVRWGEDEEPVPGSASGAV